LLVLIYDGRTFRPVVLAFAFGSRMKKRSAEKVIARSILALASYRKTTMARALRKRPRFWTEARPARRTEEAPKKRLRLKFGATGGGLTVDAAVMATPPPMPPP
jgi:hypothetical protein